MKNFEQILKTFSRSSNKGHSLVDLLAAGTLTTLIMGVAGFGLQMSLQNNQKAQADSTVFSHVTKSLVFISDEIRSAIRIESDAANAVTNDTSLSLPSGAIPILALQVPGVTERVVYYVHKPNESEKASEILYRWGPSHDANGNYKTNEMEDSNSWTSAALTDLVSSDIIANPQCESGDWQANPPANAKGFYTCVNTKTQRLVELNITSSIEPNISKEISKSYSTKVFAMAALKEGIPPNTPNYQIVGKTLTLNEPAKITFKVLGGAITCGPGGSTIPVTTNLYLDNNSTPESWDNSQSLTMNSLPSGTTVTIESIADAPFCSNHLQTVSSNDSSSPLLSVLRDGDPVPDIDPFDNQSTIDQFLQSYIENDKIKLKPNEVIYLYELGTTNTSSPAFDLQDNVVLATVDNP